MLETLQQAGLIQQPDAALRQESTPWFVQVLHAFSGWLASIFFLLMLGALFGDLFDKPWMMFLAGAFLIVGAFLILKGDNDTLFMEHMGLAISLAGQALITIALFQWLSHDTLFHPAAWFTLALFEAILIIGIPDILHRTFSSMVLGVAIFYGTHAIGVGVLGAPLILAATTGLWLHEWDDPKTIFARQAVGYGLSLSLLWHAGTGYMLDEFWYRSAAQTVDMLNAPWVISLANGLILIGLTYRLIQANGTVPTRYRIAALVFITLLALLSVWMPGLVPPIALLIVGFAHGNLRLQGLSIATLLWTTGRFYYTLQTTLLVKSSLLMAMGVALLLLYFFYRRTLRQSEDNRAA